MKKNLLIFILIVLMLSLIAGCKTSGKAIQMPTEPGRPGFGIERVVEGDKVTLVVYKKDLPANEIIIVADKLPSGVTYAADVTDDDSVSPAFNSDTLLTWIFAENVGQQLGELTINDILPETLTYYLSSAPVADAQFRGKWGLKELNQEGLIVGGDCVPDCTNKVCGNDGCNGDCGPCRGGTTCSPDNQCVAGDPDGRIGMAELGAAIARFLTGNIGMAELGGVITQFLADFSR